jgi:hypothetical protein
MNMDALSPLQGKYNRCFQKLMMYISFQFMNVSTFGQAWRPKLRLSQGKIALQKDIGDLAPGVISPGSKAPRKTMLLIFPNLYLIILVNGFLMGIAGSAGFYLGLTGEHTRVSSHWLSMPPILQKTNFCFLQNQTSIPTNNKFFLQGDLAFFYL